MAGITGEIGKVREPYGTQGPNDVERIELLVLQPTSFCSIDCQYCYLPARHVRRRMSRATLERIAQRILPSRHVGDQLTAVWHAGEPLVLPIPFYEEALALFEEPAPRD